MTTQFEPDLKAYNQELNRQGNNSLTGINSTSSTSYSNSQLPVELISHPSAVKETLSKPPAPTLRQQLLRTILPTVLLPLAITSGVGYNTVHRNAETQIKQELQNQALLAGETASDLLDDTVKVLEKIATNPLVIDFARTSSQKAEADKLPQLPIEELEKRFAATKLLQPNQVLNNYLIRIAKIEGLTEIAFTERHGFYIAHTNLTSDFVQNDELWWQKGKSETQWISEPEFDDSAGSFGVEVIQAILDPDSGEFLGVIEAVLPSNQFDEVASELLHANIHGSQQVQLLDTNTKQVTSTVTADGGTDVRQVVGGEAVMQAAAILVKAIQDPTLAPEQVMSEVKSKYSLRNLIINKVQEKSEEPILIASFTHQGRQYTLAPMPQTNWVAVASMNTGEIAAAGNKLVLIFALTFLILGGVTIAIVRRLARQLSEPLSNLSDTAIEVASGKLNVTAELSGTAEIHTLGQTFNNLVTQVQGFLQKQINEAEQVRLFENIAASRARSSKDLEQVFNRAVQGALRILKADRVVVYRFYPDWRGYISAEAVIGDWPEALGDKIEDACIGPNLIEAYRKGRVVATNNVYEAGFHPDHLRLMKRLEIQANLVAPIQENDRLFGLLIAHHCSSPHVWQESEVNFLKELAIRVGLALDRVSSLEQIEQSREKAERLALEQRQQKEILQQQLLELLGDIEGVARGDLTVRADVTVGEIGTVADFFNSVVESLRSIVTQVKQAATQVNTSLGENETAIRQLSIEALKQAEETTRTLDSVQAMTSSIQEVAENARQAESVARTASKTAVTGGVAMDRTVENIFMLRETVADTAKKVKRLGESSQRISKVASLIEQIAMQTKLLAINAGIEAAIAGEQGQGFAVVAEQVGELALRAAKATKEIEQLVESIQLETAEVVDAMELGTSQVVEGTHLVEEAKQSLSQMLEVSRQIDRLVQSISSATVSQVETSQVVTELMKEIALISERTSNSTRQVSSSLQETVGIARELNESVSTFRVGTEG